MMSNSKTDFVIAELKAIVEDAYPVGKIATIESIACDEEELLWASGGLKGVAEPGALISLRSSFRTSFRIAADTGEYFLKRVSDWIGDARLADTAEFIKQVNQQNHSLSPALQISKNGKTHIVSGESRYQLYSFVEQEKRQIWMHPELSQEDCLLSGALLAKMHFAGCQLLPEREEGSESPFQDAPRLSQEAAILRFEETWDFWMRDIFLAPILPDSVLELVADSKSSLRSRLAEAIAMTASRPEAKLSTLVHGDYHPGNVLFFKDENGKKNVSLVDFDHMRWEHPFYDIGYGLIMFSRRLQPDSLVDGSHGFAHQRIDWQLARSFVQGYVEALHIDSADSLHLQSFKSAIASCDADLLTCYAKTGCYLIMDWAADRLINGPAVFADIYAGVIEMTCRLICDDALPDAQRIWQAAVKEKQL